MSTPAVNFVQNHEFRIAWAQWGTGPAMVLVPPLFSNVELQWEHEFGRRVLDWVGRHCRVISYDKRGMGLSDRSDDPPTLDERVSDMVAVLDAAAVESATIVGLSEGGIICQHFAAAHPARVDKMVLANSTPGVTISDLTTTPEESADKLGFFLDTFGNWGQNARVMLERFAPDHCDNESFVQWMERYQRQSASANDVMRHAADVLSFDAWDVLPEISVPTLVANCEGDQIVAPDSGDLLADRIPGATRLRFPGGDHFYWFGKDWLEVAAPIVEFITEEPSSAPSQRRFASVIFTDIVDSTRATAEAGDSEWRDVLDQHDRLAETLCEQLDGHLVKSTGDGLLAYFDSPSQAVDFARALRTALGPLGVHIRAGVHVGEIEVRHNGDLTGVAVNLAARVEQVAADGCIYVSSTVRDMMLGGDHDFADRGEHELKGIDGAWRVYELLGP